MRGVSCAEDALAPSKRRVIWSIVPKGIVSLVMAPGLVTASGSPGGNSGGGGDSGGEYVIGTIAALTGRASEILRGVGPTVDAATQWVNANGGIRGHHVRAMVEDDADTPATGIAAAKKLVSQDHVLAVVGSASNSPGTLPD
jgi:branched-chain amino acid transport system substrate-binding protein